MGPPWGLHGGLEGAVSLAITRADGTVEQVQKATDVQFRVGDRITYLTAGGGGYGDPRARARDQVEQDVRAGLVSREAAAADYGYTDAPARRAVNA